MTVLGSIEAIVTGSRAPSLEFAYIDESGNTGPVAKGGTRTFTLGCMLVPVDAWTDRLDVMVEARRSIRRAYGIRMQDELKANYLLKGRGPLHDLQLGDGQRRDIYKRLLHASNIVSSGVFAIVIDKERLSPAKDPFDTAWEYLLQRLRIRSEMAERPIVVVHDDGDRERVRKIHRRFRRFSFAPGGTGVAAPLLVEDPVARDSRNSYFVQSADLLAYSAFRAVQPPSPRQASVCSEQMWGEVRPLWAREVERRRRDGIVVYPA